MANPINWVLDADEVAALPLEERQERTAAIKETRRRMERHGSVLGPNDGSNKDTLREWLEGLERAHDYCGANDGLLLELLGQLAQGSLARCVATYLHNLAPQDRTWENVKNEIFRLFMNEEEVQQLRARLSELYQKPYEDAKTYGRNFQLHAQRAYDAQNLANALIQEQLVRMFISGLRDELSLIHI